MRITKRHDGPEPGRILNELARTVEPIPAVAVDRVDEDTLTIDSDELGREQELRELLLARLNAIDLGWHMHVELED